MLKKPRKQNKSTFTKIWVNRLMWFSMLCLSLSYVLAFIGKEQIAETLSSTIATEVIGVMSGYFLKSFFETRQESHDSLWAKKNGIDQDTDSFG